MSISAVIFDVGGVLLHEQEPTARAAWERKLGLQPGMLTEIVLKAPPAAHAATGAVTEREVWEYVAGQIGLPVSEVPELQRDYWSNEALDETIAAYVKGLRPRYRVGILSNAWSDARSFHNTRFRMNEWVDDAVYSAEVRLIKPDPRIYAIVMDHLATRPEQCVFVDDLDENVRAAVALGMHGVACRSTQQTITEIEAILKSC